MIPDYHRTSFGKDGEDLAAKYLEEKGYRILERNYRFQREEVDLICFQPYERYEEGGEIVVVEVKTRRGTGFGYPEESVTREKQKAIFRVTEAYLHDTRPDQRAEPHHHQRANHPGRGELRGGNWELVVRSWELV